MQAPCKGCTTETGRSETCHPTCQRYIDWCTENELRKKKLNEARTIDRLNSESAQKGFSIRRKFKK